MMKRTTGKILLWLACLTWVGQIYGQGLIEEKISIQTDREVYLAGEEIWISLECSDAAFSRPSPLSKVAYVELWKQDQQLVSQQKVFLKNAKSTLNIQLPTNLPTSYYILRAYTLWMSSNPNKIPQRQIAILQADEALPLKSKESEESNLLADIQLFPEGGSLLNGYKQRIGIKFVDAYGNGVQSQGEIQINNGSLKIPISSSPEGFASFEMIATDMQSIRYLPSDSSSALPLNLPKAQKEGSILSLINFKEGIAQVDISSFPKRTEKVFLHVEKNGLALEPTVVQLIEGKANSSLSIPNFLYGKIALVLKNEEGIVLAKRFLYKQNEGLNKENESLLFDEGNSISTRVNTAIKLDLPVLNPGDQAGDSVYINYTLRSAQPSISEKIKISPGNLSQEEANLWALCQSVDLNPGKDLQLENQGFVIRGKTFTNSGQSVPKAKVSLSLISENPILQHAYSDKDGFFEFILSDIHGRQELVLFAKNEDGIPVNCNILPPTNVAPPSPLRKRLTFSEEDLPRLNQLLKNQQIQQAFQEFDEPSTQLPSKQNASFWGEADEKYILEEYERFVMSETFTEIVYRVNLRNKGGNYQIFVEDNATQLQMIEPALVVVDGIPFEDLTNVMKMRSSQIDFIEVLHSPYVFQGEPHFGIVHISTLAKDASAIELPTYYLREEIFFPSAPKSFVSIGDGQSSTAKLPPHSNLVDWKENIGLKAEQQSHIMVQSPKVPGEYELLLWYKDGWGRQKSFTQKILVEE